MKQSNPTVLIIEDDQFQQELLQIWLESQQYQVKIAENGEEALAAVAEQKPDLILLDLLMPGLDGFAVAKQLKQQADTCSIPVIVVTALEEQEKRIEALETGVDDFLNKPVDRIELLVRVRNLLKSRHYFQQLQDRQAHLFQLETLASLGTLITSVSNALNQPLYDLKNIIELSRQQLDSNSTLDELLLQAQQAAERIDLIAHNMQLYVKSVSASTSESSCNVDAVVEQVLELLSRPLTQANIQLHTDIEADLPPVACHAEGLMHVLVHLLLNARDTLIDYPNAQIQFSIKATDQQITFSVCDNNAKQACDMYSLITDPLFSARLPGVCEGLGLALACHFIEQSGGTISVDSTAGKGCCMRVVLNAA